MNTAIFVLIVAFTVGSFAKELHIGVSFEVTHPPTEHEEESKTARDENSGKCGGLSWSFEGETSTLTISGRGVMSCCNASYVPWSQFLNQVQNIVIQESVSSIGQYAFNNCTSLKTVNITSNITSIGYGAFRDCKNLTSINIPSSVTSIGSYVFLWM